MYQWAEERPQYQIARPTYRPSGNYAALMQSQAAQTERAGERAAEQIGQMIERPVAAYQKSAREAREERRQQLAEERMQGLSDLQKRQLEQQIASEEEFGRPEREARLGAYKTEAARAETERKLADMRVKQAEQEAEIMGRTAPSGRSFAEEKILAPIEETRQNMELARKQVEIAEQNAIVNRNAQAENTKLVRLNISAAEKEQRVQDLAAQIQTETNPQMRQSKIDALTKLASPAEMAAALKQVRGEEAQAAFWESMNRNNNINYQQEVALRQQANEQIRVQNEVLSRIDSGIQEIERAAPGSADQRRAARRTAEALSQLGYEEDAKEVLDLFTISPMNFFTDESVWKGRAETAKEIRSRVVNAMANNLDAQYGGMPDYKRVADEYRQRALNMGQIVQIRNIFAMPQQSATAYPSIPPLYNPPGQAQSGQPQFVRAPDGTLQLQGAPQPAMGGAPGQSQMPGQPATLGPQANAPLFNVLKQGKPVTQQAGR